MAVNTLMRGHVAGGSARVFSALSGEPSAVGTHVCFPHTECLGKISEGHAFLQLINGGAIERGSGGSETLSEDFGDHRSVLDGSLE
jgi:hypothetical protein